LLYRQPILMTVTILWAVIGAFLGFGFGVGCALAVMYSIFAGGYRAALKDLTLPEPPKRLLKARARLRQP